MKSRIVSTTLLVLGVLMISIAAVVKQEISFSTNKINATNREEKLEVVKLESANNNNKVVELSMEQTPQSIYIPPRVEVYEGMTLEELGAKLDRSLNGVLSGKGNLIAKTCIDSGVDPYIDEGIVGMIQNLGNNYFSHGRNTVETIAPKYAEGVNWPNKINWYISVIRTN